MYTKRQVPQLHLNIPPMPIESSTRAKSVIAVRPRLPRRPSLPSSPRRPVAAALVTLSAVIALSDSSVHGLAQGQRLQAHRQPLAQLGRPVTVAEVCKDMRDRDGCDARNVAAGAGGRPEFRCYWNGTSCLIGDVCPSDCAKSQTCRRCPSMPDLCQPNYLPCPSSCSSFPSEPICNAWSTRRANLSACAWDQAAAKCIGNERTLTFPTAILSVRTTSPTLAPTPSVLDQSPESTADEPIGDATPAATSTPESVSGSEPVSLVTLLYASGSLALVIAFALTAMIAHWRYKRRKSSLADPYTFEHAKPSWSGGPGSGGGARSDPSSPATLEAVPLTGNSVIQTLTCRSRPSSPTTAGSASMTRAGTPPSSSRLTTVSWSRSRSRSGSRYGPAAGSVTRSLDRSAGMTFYPVSRRQDWMHEEGSQSTREERVSVGRGRSVSVASLGDGSGSRHARTTISSSRETSTTLQRPSTSMSILVSRVQSPAISEPVAVHSFPPRLPSLEFPSTLSRPSATGSSLASTPTTPAPIPRPSPAWPVTSMKPMLPASDQLSTPVPSSRRGILAPGRAQPAAVSPNRLLINSMVVSERDIVLDTVTPDQARMTMISFLDSEVGLHAGTPAPTPGVSRPPAFGLRQLTAAPDTSTLSSVYALNNASATGLTERTEYSPFLTPSDLMYRELMLMSGASRPQSSVMPSPSVVSTLFAPAAGASSTVAMVGSPKNRDMLAGQVPVTPVSPYSMYDIGYYVEPGLVVGASPEVRGKQQQGGSTGSWWK